MNDLSTILDDAGARAEVQKWLDDSWMERPDYDWGLADVKYAETLKLPENGGQYLEASRKKEIRRPQNLPNGSQNSDPKSGVVLSESKVVVPVEYIQEYVGVGTTAQITSRHDLESWAKEDLPRALRKRTHELVQNAIKCGRMTPGVWAADGTEETAFDASAEPTVTIYGVSFTFKKGHKFYAGATGSHASLQPNSILTMGDFDRVAGYFRLNGAPKIGNRYHAYISDAQKRDLMKDEEYREAVIAWSGKGLADDVIVDYKGWVFHEDDAAFAEAFGKEDVRLAYGPLHTAFCFGGNAFGFLRLGGKSPLKPTFKVQDITKTGVTKTIGYLIPSQQAVLNETWCASLVGAVSNWDPTNM